MLNIDQPRAAASGTPTLAGLALAPNPGLLALTLMLAACSEEPEADSSAKPEFACSSVRSEYQKAQAHLRQRIEEVRAADEAAHKDGKSDVIRNRQFQQLMAEVERAEDRFAVRSKECVGD
ncbi:MAG TPA: hypothetical protein VFZ91_15475 [Allosphingosinicella sp.]